MAQCPGMYPRMMLMVFLPAQKLSQRKKTIDKVNFSSRRSLIKNRDSE
jgi:hypothetical protein